MSGLSELTGPTSAVRVETQSPWACISSLSLQNDIVRHLCPVLFHHLLRVADGIITLKKTRA
jgi:hypothetical protein